MKVVAAAATTAAVVAGCSVGSERAEPAGVLMPVPDVVIADPAPPEVLAVVVTPSPIPLPPTATAEPTVAPTPTILPSRVVVHSIGDWLIDGDEIVTVHASPAGEPVGALAVGVQVSATGTGRVLDGVTWVEITMPDAATGFVRSNDLRVAHQARPTAIADGRDLIGPVETPVAEAAATAQPAATATAEPTVTPTLTATPPVATATPAAVDGDTFTLASFDTSDRSYVVTRDDVVFYADIDNELIDYTTLSVNVVVEVLRPEGQIINAIPMARVRFQNIAGWIALDAIRRLNP